MKLTILGENLMIGGRIKDLRCRRNLTQTECGRLLNVSSSTIGMWETNQRSPDFDKLIEISKLFNVSIDWLVGSEDDSRIVEVKVPQSSNAVTIIGSNGLFETYIIKDSKIKVLEEFAKALSENEDKDK